MRDVDSCIVVSMTPELMILHTVLSHRLTRRHGRHERSCIAVRCTVQRLKRHAASEDT